MKYAVIIGDGMADEPLERLGGRTPLEAADIPNMREISRRGLSGRIWTVPPGMPPGSDVATLSVLGYDPARYYSGRAPLEAARLGLTLQPDEVAFRCNLITAESGLIADYSGGHIATEESRELVASLDRHLGGSAVRFHPGVGYRHICILKGPDLVHAECTPPHDVTGRPVEDYLPRGSGAERLIHLMRESRSLLEAHQVNRARISRGQRPANMIWLWGQGVMPSMPSFRERFGIQGAAISAVDLVNGIAKLIGLELIEVPGATGYYDTNYSGKGEAAVRALEKCDFVMVHVEAPDEAGHNGDAEQKVKAIERLDRLVVGPILRRIADWARGRLLVLPDHPTPVRVRTHTAEPVPFACCGAGIEGSGTALFSECHAALGPVQMKEGWRFMARFIGAEKLVE